MSKEMFGANQACRLLRFNHCTVHTDSFVTIDIIITILYLPLLLSRLLRLFIMADHRYDSLSRHDEKRRYRRSNERKSGIME